MVLHLCSAVVRKHLEGWFSSGLLSLPERDTQSRANPAKASKLVMDWSTGCLRRGGRSEASSALIAEGL